MKKYAQSISKWRVQRVQNDLAEVVMSVLIEHKNGCGLRQISELTGIYRTAGKAGMNDAIVVGLLNKLHGEQKIERVGTEKSNRKWRCLGASSKIYFAKN